MSKMSFQLAKALKTGRANNGAPSTREALLARLLRKRAAAHKAGLMKQEQALRSQIVWALPIHEH